jgi:hypothetical protein
MDILTARKGASLAVPEQQSSRIMSPRGGVVVVVVVVVVVGKEDAKKVQCDCLATFR